MNTINMPGFTAETSLYKHRTSYRMMTGRNGNDSSGVIPQMAPSWMCEYAGEQCDNDDLIYCKAWRSWNCFRGSL